MKVTVNSKEVTNFIERVQAYDDKCYNALTAYGKISAKNLENKAKKNAKWIDRTGQARKSIKGDAERTGENITITLEGYATQDNKEYFQYLELYHQKKNAILKPTIDDNYDEVLKGCIKTLSKVEL